jgi:hypothetical protein
VRTVSQYFRAGGTVLWNPSNGVGLLFVRTAEALEPVAGVPSGIVAADADEWEIHMPVFERFVDALVDRYRRSTHLILRSLMEGFVATSLVLVERGGGGAPALPPEAGRLEELRDAHSRAMPG